MAKPIVELLSELQKAVAKLDVDRAAMDKASADAAKRHDAAKAAYEKEAAAATASAAAATVTFNDTSAYVTTLQAEMNKVLGLATSDPRVRVG